MWTDLVWKLAGGWRPPWKAKTKGEYWNVWGCESVMCLRRRGIASLVELKWRHVIPSVRPSSSARVQSSLHSLHLLRKLNCCASIYHSAVCLTTGPQPLSEPVPHTVRTGASSYSFQYPIFSLRPSSRCLRLLHRLPITVLRFSISFNNVYRGSAYARRG